MFKEGTSFEQYNRIVILEICITLPKTIAFVFILFSIVELYLDVVLILVYEFILILFKHLQRQLFFAFRVL